MKERSRALDFIPVGFFKHYTQDRRVNKLMLGTTYWYAPYIVSSDYNNYSVCRV